ncbi:unnamed protein product [Pleuronectes platessa]|uniref:Uncharacterized protein n=1 Tax=Pleuronectes platessa TaxID=8262 RepID=A0A9N7YL12_PLEPL|nr:unnamed protein product [Pleuronectes platessa]
MLAARALRVGETPNDKRWALHYTVSSLLQEQARVRKRGRPGGPDVATLRVGETLNDKRHPRVFFFFFSFASPSKNRLEYANEGGRGGPTSRLSGSERPSTTRDTQEQARVRNAGGRAGPTSRLSGSPARNLERGTALDASGSASPSARSFGLPRPTPKRLPNGGIPGVLRPTSAQLGANNRLEYTTRGAGPAWLHESQRQGDPLSERRPSESSAARAFGSPRPRPKRLPNAGIPGVIRHTGCVYSSQPDRPGFASLRVAEIPTCETAVTNDESRSSEQEEDQDEEDEEEEDEEDSDDCGDDDYDLVRNAAAADSSWCTSSEEEEEEEEAEEEEEEEDDNDDDGGGEGLVERETFLSKN